MFKVPFDGFEAYAVNASVIDNIICDKIVGDKSQLETLVKPKIT